MNVSNSSKPLNHYSSSSSSSNSRTDPSALLGHPILEGWMLKKKRKKMQGFARRYFYLSQEPALLSYSFSPNTRIRDSVLISLSSISISRKSRSIHLDSGGSLVMHIKTLNDSDFVKWTTALQSLASSNLMERRRRRRIQQRKDASKALPKNSELSVPQAGPSVRPVEMSNLYHSVARMQAPLAKLEAVQAELGELLQASNPESLSAPPSFEASPPQPSTPFLGPPLSASIPPSGSPSSNRSPSNNKFSSVNSKGKKPKIFKNNSSSSTTANQTVHQRSSDSQRVLKVIKDSIDQLKAEQLNLVDLINVHRSSIGTTSLSTAQPTNTTSNSTVNNNRSSAANLATNLTANVNVLKKRLSKLSIHNNESSQSLQSSSTPSSSSGTYLTPTDSIPTRRRNRSSTITRADSNSNSTTILDELQSSDKNSKSNSRRNSRNVSSNNDRDGRGGDHFEEEGNDSESDIIFHDAEEEDLIFVDLDESNFSNVETEAEGGISGVENGNVDDSDSEFSSEEDDEEEEEEDDDDDDEEDEDDDSDKEEDGDENKTPISKEDADKLKSLNPESSKLDHHQQQPLKQNERSQDQNQKGSMEVVKRRTKLPAVVSGEEFSVFAFFKKNVGKDLSQVSFPISFNEPLSALQKLCEEFEYVDETLNRATSKFRREDPVKRLVYVCCYIVSGYAGTKGRVVRKPFNPMLGETYECVRPDKKFRFISEKVVHHPPSIAAYAEGENWKIEINSSIRQKFWGQSVEIIHEGLNRLTIFNDDDRLKSSKDLSSKRVIKDDVYVWDKPSSFVRNLMSGTKYLEHIGKVSVTNLNGTEKATIDFKPGTTFGGESSRNKVEIKVYDQRGKLKTTLNGRWDSYLKKDKKTSSSSLSSEDEDADEGEGGMIFKANELPKNSNLYYGFSKFAIELNEITEDLRGILPDSDSRLRPDQRLFEEGDVEGADEIKRVLEENQRIRRRDGNEIRSNWFERGGRDGKDWIYKGGYFESRQKNPPDWKTVNIFKN